MNQWIETCPGDHFARLWIKSMFLDEEGMNINSTVVAAERLQVSMMCQFIVTAVAFVCVQETRQRVWGAQKGSLAPEHCILQVLAQLGNELGTLRMNSFPTSSLAPSISVGLARFVFILL